MKAKIPSPCSANWDQMKIGHQSRHCLQCEKNVMDFTQFSREQIIEYLLLNQHQRVCGRILPHQLDFSHTQHVTVIRSIQQKYQRSSIPLYLFALGSIVLVGCQPTPLEIEEDTIVQLIEDHEIVFEPVYTHTTSAEQDTSQKTINDSAGFSLNGGCITMGDIVLPVAPLTGVVALDVPSPEHYTWEEPEWEDELDDETPYTLVENMPSLSFGNSGLNDYVLQHLSYPESDREAQREGTVWVSFTVTSKGTVIEPEVDGMVDGSEAMKQAVLQLIDEMPDWKPGEHRGENVAVRMVLPIKFKLNEENQS